MNKPLYITCLIIAISISCTSTAEKLADFSTLNDEQIISEFSGKSSLLPEEKYRLAQAYRNSDSLENAYRYYAMSAFTKNYEITDITPENYFSRKSSHSDYYNPALSRIIDIFYSQGRYKDAISVYSRLNKEDPALFFNSSLVIANCHTALGQTDKAALILEGLKSIASGNGSFDKLRLIRLAGIMEKTEKPEKAFHLYLSLIRTENQSWQSQIAVKNIFRLFQYDTIKTGINEKFIIAEALTANSLFEESELMISQEKNFRFLKLRITNLIGLKRPSEADTILENEKQHKEELLKAYSESLWKYSSSANASAFSEKYKLYETDEYQLQKLTAYYLRKDIIKASEYLTILNMKFKANRENENLNWLIAKEFIEQGNKDLSARFLEVLAQNYVGGSYYGNALYWLNKINNNPDDEQLLKKLLMFRPDSVYVFRTVDRIKSRFTINFCTEKFNEAVSLNDRENIIFYHFLLFSLEKNNDILDRRIRQMENLKLNYYSDLNKFLASQNDRQFLRYEKLFKIYKKSGDFESISVLENYLSDNPEIAKQTYNTLLKLFNSGDFYYKKYLYAVKLLKLTDLKENISFMNSSLRETFYPLAYYETVKENCIKNKLDPLLIISVIRAESAFNSSAVSTSKAKGLMQLMDRTAADLSLKTNRKNYDIFSPDDNIAFGTYYFKWLENYFSGNTVMTIGAYNAGPGNMKKWVKAYGTIEEDYFIEKIPFAETRNYILNIQKYRSIYEKIY